MLYESTRGHCEPLTFQQALLTGQASDGGLLMPHSIPDIRDRIDAWRSLGYVELCEEVVALFVKDIDRKTLRDLIRNSYATFDHREVVELVPVENRHVLELFHGPTLAFKDVALQLVGNLFDHVLQNQGGNLNILGATSGDTGSAAIAGVRGRKNIQIFVMYPHGRISPLQELQMTTVDDPNVHCLALKGSFDDCQSIMKEIFNDTEFKQKHQLGAVNSVNWARVMIQIVYYIYSALRFDEEVTFSVPTGNFGNILAGLIAKRMGAPISNFILATNENDILARYFTSGLYKRGPVHQTTSPSMDIQVASNFERFVFLQTDKEAEQVTRFMERFAASGEAKLAIDDDPDDKIYATQITRTRANETIAKYASQYDYVLEPHSAIGVAASEVFDLDGPNICLATAHPAKFPEAIQEALPERKVTHEKLEKLKTRPSDREVLDADVSLVKDYIQGLSSGLN